MYKLFNNDDVDDQAVYFSLPAIRLEQIKNLAVFIQFKAEEMFSDSVVLLNSEIVGYLKRFGAKVIDTEPESFIEIEMKSDRDVRNGDWRMETYKELDAVYGAKATVYLQKIDLAHN